MNTNNITQDNNNLFIFIILYCFTLQIIDIYPQQIVTMLLSLFASLEYLVHKTDLNKNISYLLLMILTYTCEVCYTEFPVNMKFHY